jgi:hypothetical protein
VSGQSCVVNLLCVASLSDNRKEQRAVAVMSSNENINVPGYLVVLWLFLIVFIIFMIRHYAYRPDFPWHSVRSFLSPL